MNRKEQREAMGAAGLLVFIVIAAAVSAALLVTGCATQYGGGKVTDGLSVSAGARLPASETVQITLFNYLSGFNFSFDDNAAAEMWYSTTNSVSFCYGLYDSSTVKNAHVKLEPCIVYEAATNACQCASGGECTCKDACECGYDCACGTCQARAP